MALADSPPILAQLTSARSCAEQIAALKALKNDVIGHIQKKEQWVELGVLEPLVRVLDADHAQTQLNGKSSRAEAQRALGEEEQLRLHALELLAVFASGGPPFLFPLRAVDALSVILSNVDPTESHPKLVLAALRALLNLSEASLLATPLSPYDTTSLATEIFTSQNLEALRAILSSSDDSWIQASLVNAAASLIARLCKDEQHQVALADTGVLDALATQLAGFIVAKGHVIPGADLAAQNEGLSGGIPDAASPGTSLLTIMDAISAIIADSRLRACMLIYSPAILSILPHTRLDTLSQDVPAIWHSLHAQGLSTHQWQNFGAMDFLLPAVPSHHTRSSASQISSFPPLGTSHSRENLSGYQQSPSGRLDAETSKWGTSSPDILSQIGDRELEEPESPLIPWLFALVRESEGPERLMAASILTSLYKAGFASRSREPALAMLIVPLLLQTLHTLAPELSQNGSTWIDSGAAGRWNKTQLTLTVLARLVTDSELVQKAAFECDAVKVVGRLLKDSYEPLSTRSQPRTWNPSPQDDSAMAAEGGPGHRVLGPPGQLAWHAYRAGLRESVLKAVAAIVSFKEEYRKAFVEEDIMPYIVESLVEHPTKPSKSKDRAKPSKDGSELTAAQAEALYGNNPINVLIAACHTIRMLSRSVSILRTALIDAGVAQPIFSLLRHPELEVQVAATGAICNLVLDVSPMKERLVELGIMKVLCEHAHSQHAPLRLNALWALKHFVDGVGAETKKACVDELEPGWLVRLICDDTEDEALYARMKSEKQTPVPRGDDMDEDVEMDQEEEARSWGTSSLHRASFPRTSHERTKTLRLRQAESRLAALREAELNPVRRARSDDLAIQEQGLDFIRNILGPAGSSNMDAQQETTEMIDYLFSELGQDRLFEILASKLRVKVLHPFGRRTAGGGGQNSRVLYPQAKIVEAVMYVLVHIAASVPRHRQLVIAQTDLLKLLSNHFTNKDKNVRLALCHLVANLTWRDSTTDTQSSSQRAHELKRLGMLSKIEKLAADDAELDVRERAKSAKWQISQSNNEY